MAARTRLADIANLAGVSTATVSRVLNQKPGVSDDCRNAVLAALEMLGYELPERPRNRSREPVGLVVAELTNPVYPLFTQYLQTHLAGAGFTTLLCIETPGGLTEDQYLEVLVAQGVAGIIFVGGLHADTCEDTSRYQQLLKKEIPFVFINGTNANVRVPSFATNERMAMEIIVRHLRSLGHTQIGLCTGQRRYAVTQEKMAGFQAAMRQHCDNYAPHIVSTFFGVEGGAAGAATLLGHGCTAIVCGSDLMALGAIHHAHSRGLDVPADVSVVGFDDGPLLGHTSPPLTTLRQPVEAIARSAVATLRDLIAGDSVPLSEVLFDPELIVRSSTGPAPFSP